jgi:putative ABC transport system permease protein
MLQQHLVYSLRAMRQTAGFSAAIVLIIALAIAGNSVVFSIVNAELLRPMPFRDPDRIVQVAERNDKLNLPTFAASVLNFLSWREQSKDFEELGAIGFAAFTFGGAGEPEQLTGNRISPALMRILGLTPIAGRAFRDDEEKPGAEAVAMIDEGLWKRRFGADPNILGRVVTLNGAPATIVGVAPAALSLLGSGDIYVPLVIDPGKEIRLNHVIAVFARLKRGASIAQAQSRMDVISSHMRQQFPEMRDWGVRVLSMTDTFITPQFRTGLTVLMWAVAFVLLIACANVANLLLARATARQRELAVRAAMGASRGQLTGQLLAESIVLSLLGGAIGIAGAFGILRFLTRVLPPTLLPIPDIGMDGRVLLFALTLTLISGLMFGTVPALRMANVDLNEVLKQEGRGATGTHGRLRRILACGEIVLATVLLIGAGLLIRTLENLQGVRLGFDAHGLITFQLAPPITKYPLTGKAQQFYRTLLGSLDTIPGVQRAAASSGIPFGQGNYNTSPWSATDSMVLGPDDSVPIDWRLASPSYFKVMEIPLLLGRDFTDRDIGPSEVVILSQSAAKKLFGGANPLGHRIHRPHTTTQMTVIGVVGDVRSTSLNQESPTLYRSAAQTVGGLMDIVVRTRMDPHALLPGIHRKVQELDAQLAMANVRTMEEWVSNGAAQPRLNAALLGAFAVFALVIAAIGIYGLLAYSVTQRTREIGIRLALGAAPSSVLRLVILEGMKITVIGILFGALGGFLLRAALRSLVYEVPVHDPLTFAGVAFLLVLVAFLACAVPAFRAARVDPQIALRCD